MADDAFRDGWDKGRAIGYEEGVAAMRKAAQELALERDEARAGRQRLDHAPTEPKLFWETSQQGGAE
ncbi:MAG: hypothetical protein BroJett013_06690 [Alphaproteobacteria bacterium]|nr:MAG: hypothetical protein BroJett013_06690 [Alphaproteobacteria bacterium]